jgi:hypothetical protein
MPETRILSRIIQIEHLLDPLCRLPLSLGFSLSTGPHFGVQNNGVNGLNGLNGLETGVIGSADDLVFVDELENKKSFMCSREIITIGKNQKKKVAR